MRDEKLVLSGVHHTAFPTWKPKSTVEFYRDALGLPVRLALRRVRATASQTGLTKDERHRNIRGAFAPSRLPWRSTAVRDRIVVLVDDVSTTGATLEECARVVTAMGAREVRAVTAARAVMSQR